MNKVIRFRYLSAILALAMNASAAEVLDARVWEELGDLASAKGATLGERKELFLNYVMSCEKQDSNSCIECLKETNWPHLRTSCEKTCVVVTKPQKIPAPEKLNQLQDFIGRHIQDWITNNAVPNQSECTNCLAKTPWPEMESNCANACLGNTRPLPKGNYLIPYLGGCKMVNDDLVCWIRNTQLEFVLKNVSECDSVEFDRGLICKVSCDSAIAKSSPHCYARDRYGDGHFNNCPHALSCWRNRIQYWDGLGFIDSRESWKKYESAE